MFKGLSACFRSPRTVTDRARRALAEASTQRRAIDLLALFEHIYSYQCVGGAISRDVLSENEVEELRQCVADRAGIDREELIRRADPISRDLGHNYIGTEHLLTLLADVADGDALKPRIVAGIRRQLGED